MQSHTAIGILHLTDFHQGMAGQKTLWPSVKESFFEDLAKLHDKAGPWDLVVFTGDLTQRGSAAEFAAFDATLAKLWERLGALGSHPALLAVPGNHDLSRPDASAGLDALREWHTKSAVAEAFFASATDPARVVVHHAFSAYDEWWHRRTTSDGLVVTPGALPGDFATTFAKNGLQLAIVGLNSSFLQLRDRMVPGELAVDLRQLLALKEDLPDWLGTHHAALLLTHHPIEWLHEVSRRNFRGEINRPGRFVAHLFGHMHEGAARVVSDGGAVPRRGLQGLSLFGLETVDDTTGRHTERLHGYTAMRLEICGVDGTLTIWPRSWEENKVAEFWRMVPDHQRYELADGISLAMSFNSLRAFDTPTTPRSKASTLRLVLANNLRDASDFDAFCLDHFPEVYRRFSNGMDRVARETLLLQHVDHATIREVLELSTGVSRKP